MSTNVEYFEDLVVQPVVPPTYTLRPFRGIFIGLAAGAAMWTGIIALVVHLL
jgi:hypothetical protein